MPDPPRNADPLAVHVLTRLILGGPSRPVLATLGRLVDLGYRVRLVRGAPGGHEVALAPEQGRAIPADLVPTLVRDPSPARDLAALVALRRAFRAFGPAVVHTHTAKAGALGRVAARAAARGVRTVHTFHGHSLDRSVSGWSARAWCAFERGLGARASDALVALSPAQREDLLQRLGAGLARKLHVVPLPFSPADYGAADGPADDRGADALRAELRRPGSRLLVFVGRGVPVKGLAHLADAGRRLAAIDPATARRLAIAVIGPLDPGVRATLERLEADSDAPRWRLCPPVANPFPYLAVADAVVLPSLSEGTPVVVLEALSLGVPVIASAVGGVPDLLARDWRQDGPGAWRTLPCAPRGLLLAPADRDAWTRALSDFVRHPESVPGEPAERRRFVRATFDADARVAELAEIYASLGVVAEPRIRAASAGM